MAAPSEADIVKSELKWSLVVLATLVLISGAILWAGLVRFINPPSNHEMLDPKTLHLSGEFTEANLGTRVENGQVTARIIATQFMFLPDCVVVPADEQVTFRFTSPDVIHGILITGTNVNTMIIPGFVSQVHTILRKTGDLLMPCHEFCGIGHSQMWSVVRVVPREQFKPDANGRVACEKS
jgi:cytochrome c oxidase subunit II